MNRSSLFALAMTAMVALFLFSNCSCKPKPEIPKPDSGKDFPFQRLAETPEQAAELALQYLAARGQKDSMYFKFGFPTLESLKSAKLGHAVRTIQVDCHKMNDIGNQVTSLKDLHSLAGSSQTLYPVANGESTRMGVWVDSISNTKGFNHKKDKGRFTMIRMGGSETAIHLLGELQKMKVIGIQEEIILVELPTFGQTFAAFEENGKLYARQVRQVGYIDSVCQVPKDKSLPWQEIVTTITQCPQFKTVYCLNGEQVLQPNLTPTAHGDSAAGDATQNTKVPEKKSAQ